MALETFPDYTPSRGSGPRTRARVLKKQFGDSYAQQAAAGLNNIELRYRAIFATRPNAEIDAIETFLRTHGGHTAFLFTVPGEASARRWTCAEWDGPRRVSAAHKSLTATFEEDFSFD